MKAKILILVMLLLGGVSIQAQKKTDDKSKSGKEKETTKTDDKAKKGPVEDTDPNMIVNGSFEQADTKVLKGRGQLHLVCKPWMSVCKTGADMYAAGNSKNKKVNVVFSLVLGEFSTFPLRAVFACPAQKKSKTKT